MSNFPYIRLEVNGLQYTVTQALTEYHAQIAAEIQAAVADYCAPDHIRQIIQEKSRLIIQDLVRDHVEQYFRYGAGKTRITEAVVATLRDEE